MSKPLFIQQLIADYLQGSMEAFLTDDSPYCGKQYATLEETLFGILTHSRYSHLGKAQALPYRESILPHFRHNIANAQAIKFYYDLGPGYHASLEPGRLGLVFDVGLGEFFALRQIALFSKQIRKIYPPGVQFYLLIDNFCALFANDIPVNKTSSYIDQLQMLIYQLGLNNVDILAESILFSQKDYESLFNSIAANKLPAAIAPPTLAEIENVARFLGNRCTASEAASRIARYHQAQITTETLLAPQIQGVRLTQRVTRKTLGFRAFSGGSARIQVGEIVFDYQPPNVVKPILLTSRNFKKYRVFKIALPATLSCLSFVCRYSETIELTK